MSSKQNGFTRRTFFGGAAATAAAFSIVPSHVLGGKNGTAPSDKFHFAQVGVGGRGGANLQGTLNAGGILVGMADVDSKRAEGAFRRHRNVPNFQDYREMLEKLGDKIDGLVVSTPDHTHAVQAMAGIKAKKHVYCEKPLARTVYECRALAEAARKNGVVTQMGNQGHSGGGLARTRELIGSGIIGKVKEVHAWTDRPGVKGRFWWNQGMTERPKQEAVPKNLNWDLWQGPRAAVPYGKGYVPFAWRGWWDYGCGAMGDMACHNMDSAFTILKLGAPSKIKVTAPTKAGLSYPIWTIVEFTFPAIEGRDEIKLFWYEGGKLPKRPEGMLPKYRFGGNGTMFVGEHGAMMGGSHAGMCRLVTKTKNPNWKKPGKTIVRSEGHYKEWIKAALKQPHGKAGKVITPGSNFDYAGPMTEAILAGCIAMRFPGKELHWDGKNMKFTNCDEANKFVHYTYRKGWSL